MATHDYILANASGAAFRTDLNNALAAIVSNNSNSSSPATTYAYQWWADTSNGVLKIRNSANNAWIELLQLDGTLTLEDGSASTPALAFRDDLNTGIYSGGVDTFNVATGGAERLKLDGSNTVFNEAGANIDFRIESDTKTHMFFLDAGNDRIGINTSSPSCMLQINDTASSGDGVTEILKLNGSPNNNNDGIKLQFARVGGACGSITLQKVSDNNTTDMIFGTRSSNTESESMRLLGGGKLLIGTTSARSSGGGVNAHLQLEGTTSQAAEFLITRNSADTYSPTIGLVKTRGTSAGSNTTVADNDVLGTIQFRGADGSDIFSVGASVFARVNGTPSDGTDMPAELVFATTADGASSPTERMSIDSSGILLLGKTSTSQTYTFQVQSDNNANAIAIYGRSSDDIAEIGYYENDGTTKLGELQYRQDHVAFRHRVGHIEFATTYSGNSVGERMRLINDQLCIGMTGGSGLGASRRLQIRGTIHSNNGINILATHNDDNPAVIDIGKSRSSGNAILGNNDDVGQINFYGNDGSGFHSMARILCSCEGHDTSNDDLPSKLRFFTLTENSTTLRERLTIDDEGIIKTCSENHALNVSTVVSAGTNKYAIRAHHSGTVGSTGSGTLTFTVWSNGNVENTNNSYGQISDETLKQDIVDASSQWDDIKNIAVRKFRFKDNPTGDLQIGVVAQEVEKVSAGLVYETGDVGEEVKAVKYSVLYMKAIKALQEAITKIEVLETKVAALEAA
jgi:hypothetical protein